MSLFSPQRWYCSCCGKEQFSDLGTSFGRIRLCSKECMREDNWKTALSSLGKAYYPDPESKQ